MGIFNYRIRDQEGRIRLGMCRAGSREEAARRLMGEGFWVLEVRPHRKRGPGFGLDPRRRIRGRDLTWFFRQLSSLIESGVPLLRALDTLQQQAGSPGLKTAVSALARDLRRGESLSGAVAAQGPVFPLIAQQMIRSGEAGGSLDIMLPRLSSYLEREQGLIKQVKMAALYPALLAVFSFCVVLFLVGYVVPGLMDSFHYDRADLPGLTRVILALGQGMGGWLGISAVLTAVLLGGLAWWRRTPAGRGYSDRLLLALPVYGPIARRLGATRLAYNVGILVQSGLSIIEALETGEALAGNRILGEAVGEARRSLHRGLSLAEAFRISGVFEPLVIQMVAIGEETGRLDESLLKVAEYYEAETGQLIKSGISLLEPALIIVMALVVGAIVGGTILPLLDMMMAF